MSDDDDDLKPRILAIDPGKKRIGLAVSDPFGNFAIGLETLRTHEKHDPIPPIEAICQDYKVGHIVIGLPLHMRGTEGASAVAAREFGEVLFTRLKIPVEYFDERLTSKMAEATLREGGIQPSRHRKEGIIDQAAAVQILQDYLRYKHS